MKFGPEVTDQTGVSGEPGERSARLGAGTRALVLRTQVAGQAFNEFLILDCPPKESGQEDLGLAGM